VTVGPTRPPFRGATGERLAALDLDYDGVFVVNKQFDAFEQEIPATGGKP
jgi:hypothetical protein